MSIEDIRKLIDATDEKLITLLAERQKLAVEIGQTKGQTSQPIVDHARETQVLNHVRQMARRAGMEEAAAENVFREIIFVSRSVQSTLVAFQGEHGAYSQQAAISFFGKTKDTLPKPNLEEVFLAVASGEVSYGVVPVENSLEGSISKTYDLLLDSELKVAGEIEYRVSHCLIVNPGTRLDDIKRVYSHPQALAQCQTFLLHMGWEAVPSYDTAGAVKYIKEKGLIDAAAIASSQAAGLYGMSVLSCSLEDNAGNYTRFFILAREDSPPTGSDKTSLVFSVKHQPGALFSFLGTLDKYGLNLTKIESRPTRRKPWEYNFYLDFEGHRENPAVLSALCELDRNALFVKILGSYPRASRDTTSCA